MLKRSYYGFFKNLNVQIPRTRWYHILKSITIRSPSCISPSTSALSFENQPTVGMGKSKLSKNIERGKLESWSERCTATDTHKIILMCGHAWGWSVAWFMSRFTCTSPPYSKQKAVWVSFPCHKSHIRVHTYMKTAVKQFMISICHLLGNY